MVNTRVLEQRLGWRSATPEGEPAPPARPISHKPVLQGRIRPGTGDTARGPRRVAIEEAWESLPAVDDDAATLAGTAQMVPSFAHGSAAGAAFDQLRTQLMRALRDNGWRRIGITSPGRGAGRSFIAAGLAASIARLEGVRVLLIDGDLEAPGLADLLGVEAPGPLEEVLAGDRDATDQTVRIGRDLAVVMNNTPVTYGTELMLAPDAILALRAMTDKLAPDVVITDLPPLLDDSITQAWLPQLDAVLLVSDGMRNTADDIAECERLLQEQVPILGIALNKSEDRDPRPRARRRV